MDAARIEKSVRSRKNKNARRYSPSVLLLTMKMTRTWTLAPLPFGQPEEKLLRISVRGNVRPSPAVVGRVEGNEAGRAQPKNRIYAPNKG